MARRDTAITSLVAAGRSRAAVAGDRTAGDSTRPRRGNRIRPPDNSGSTLASTVRFSRPYQGATPSLISKMPLSTPGRTPYLLSRPFLIRDQPNNASRRLTQQDTTELVRALTTRDIGILIALSDYRYLDRDQVQQLFFPSRRVSQRRIKWLKDHGLLYRWPMIEPPGWTRLHSLLLLSPRGARVLAACLGQDPRPLVRLSQDARDHCFNVGHDLGANAFFVALAVGSRRVPAEGLYHWVGEDRCRRLLRDDAGRRVAPAPDGWGRYLIPGREISFFLEWDRGTESVERLRRKSGNYIRYFKNRREANYAHILFVFPSSSKEAAFHKRLADELLRDELCCVFWTTTVEYLGESNSRGPIWWKVGRRAPSDGVRSSARTPEPWPKATGRVPLGSLAGRPGHRYLAANCIGKPDWWDRRLAGGQV